jgi:hypothetical protein
LGWSGKAGEHLLVERDRFLEAADPAERRRLEILVAGILGCSSSSRSSSAIASAGRFCR